MNDPEVFEQSITLENASGNCTSRRTPYLPTSPDAISLATTARAMQLNSLLAPVHHS